MTFSSTPTRWKRCSPSSTAIYASPPATLNLHKIAVSVGEEPDTIEEAYEPFLIMEGYLERTPKGRMATVKANERLGLKPAARQGILF